MKARNCTSIGWSVPISARQLLSTVGSMLPPPLASLSTQTSPGMRRISTKTSTAAPSSVGIISSRRLTT